MSDARQSIRTALLEALALKALPRAGWLRVGVQQPESVAAHSWGIAWLVLNLCPANINRARAIEIALVHDLAEVRAGDITPYDGISPESKRSLEREALFAMVEDLPARDHIVACWEEYDTGSTLEGRFVKACDKLDMALQAEIYRSEGVDTREFIESALVKLTDDDLRLLISPESED